jgi:hypothetical protein
MRITKDGEVDHDQMTGPTCQNLSTKLVLEF